MEDEANQVNLSHYLLSIKKKTQGRLTQLPSRSIYEDQMVEKRTTWRVNSPNLPDGEAVFPVTTEGVKD